MRGLKLIGVVLGGLASLGFCLFILEESLQVLMFSSWASKDLPKEERQKIVDTYASLNCALLALTYAIGIWIPPYYVAYRGYVEAGERWVSAQVAGYGLRQPLPQMEWVGWLVQSIGMLAGLVLVVGIVRWRYISAAREYQLKMPRAAGKS